MLRKPLKIALSLAVVMAAQLGRAAPPMTTGTAAAQGKALGAATNPGTAAGLTNANRAAIMPASPSTRDCMPPSATVEGYFNNGNGNLSTNSTAMLGSASVGVSPECQAINFMQGKSSTANPISINPADPLIVTGNNNINNPASSLGPTVGLFVPKPTSACAPGSVTTGGNATEEQCQDYATLGSGTCNNVWQLDIEPWWKYKCEKTPYTTSNQTCTKEEQPTVTWSQSCTPGTVIATVQRDRYGGPSYGADNIRVKAICDMSANLTFKVDAWGGDGQCVGEQTVTTARSISTQTILTDLSPHWSGYCQVKKVAVEPGSTCSNGTCNFQFTFGDPNYTCGPGTTIGSSLNWVDGDGNNYYGDAATCYATQAPNVTVTIDGTVISCDPGFQLANSQSVCFNTSGTPASVASVSGTGVAISFPEPRNVPTITDNTVSTCGGLEGNGACAPIGSNCIAGINETRTINGLPITKSCWKMEYTYSCKSGVGPDHCAPLVAEPKCAQIGVSGCSAYGPDGTCSTFNADYKCTKDMGPPANVSQSGVGYDIIKDNLDTKLCDPYTANPNCTKIGSVCVDDQDKTFFGFTFRRTCWKYEDTFSCGAPGPSNCQPLIAAGCTLIPSATTCSSYLPDGSCGTTNKTYQCGTPAQTIATGSTCDTTPYCINGICYDTTRPGDPDFGQTVAGMEVAREVGTYIDPATYEIFKGVSGTCKRKLFGLNNCCKTPSSGNDWSNAAFYAATSYARTYMGSTYTFDGLFSGDGVNWMGLAMQAGGILISGATTASVYGLTIGWSGGQLAVIGFDPTTFAIAIAVQLILTDLTSCDPADQNTAMKKAQGICEYMGTYCSSKFLGVCKTKKESYCCFNSKLAKAINIGGKKQLGKSMGTAQSPDCSGLTITEVQSLDFSTIDLSEFIASIVPDALTDAQSKATVISRLTAYAPVPPSYGNVTPPNQATPGGPSGTPPPPPPTLLEPTISASWSPSNPAISGQNVNLSTVTTNATSLSYDCTGAWVSSGSLAVGTTTTAIPIPGGLVGRSECLFTATNAQYEVIKQFDVIVGPPNPVITASFNPSSVGVGNQYNFTVNSSYADEVTYTCVGRNDSGTIPVGTYTSPWATALISELGNVSCTFSAKSFATGTVTPVTVNQGVQRVIPSVTAVPATGNVVSGSNVSISVAISQAPSATYSCTGPLTATGTVVAPSGTVVIPTSATIAGTLVCQFQATSASGDSTTTSISIGIAP